MKSTTVGVSSLGSKTMRQNSLIVVVGVIGLWLLNKQSNQTLFPSDVVRTTSQLLLREEYLPLRDTARVAQCWRDCRLGDLVLVLSSCLLQSP